MYRGNYNAIRRTRTANDRRKNLRRLKMLNNQVKTACIPSLNLGDGIYVGEAIVTNTNGRANIKIFNTNETDVKITIPTVQLEIFERADEHNVPFLGYDGHVFETQQFCPSMTSLAHVHSKDYSGDLLHIDTSELSALEQGKRATESILNHHSISSKEEIQTEAKLPIPLLSKSIVLTRRSPRFPKVDANKCYDT